MNDPQQNYSEQTQNESAAAQPSSVAQDGEDMELMKKRLQEMESEAEKLREMQEKLEKEEEELKESREDVDARSVFVGNVDFGSTPEELQAHFQSCGSINRVTILCDRFTGQPKGYAYIEFAEPSLVGQALVLNESIFRGRNIKVTPKRTNMPGFNGRGGRGRGRGPFRGALRAGFRGAGAFRGGFRGRARGAFMPY